MSDVPRGPDWWQDKDGRWYPSHVPPAEDDTRTSQVPPEPVAELTEESDESLPEYFARTYGWGRDPNSGEEILVIGGGMTATRNIRPLQKENQPPCNSQSDLFFPPTFFRER